MTTKIVNLFDPITGVFIGVYEAQESPLEPGIFIEPIHSTELPLPVLGANECAVFVSGAWTVSPDFRGQTFYDQTTGAAVEITAHGLPAANLGALPPPQTLAEQIASFTAAVQAHLDAEVQVRGYNSIMSCVSYITSTNPTFRAEATAASAWRDAVWAYCYAELVKVQAGTRGVPASTDAFIAELPVLVW